ncbi:hypothetical protein [Limosilactobacillus equigenerosi]|nr:hypothetical protein [Limosilactobacillus equigenerosi]
MQAFAHILCKRLRKLSQQVLKKLQSARLEFKILTILTIGLTEKLETL